MDRAHAEPPAISSSFPNPPPFYHSFTPANIAAISALRREFLRSQHPKETVDPLTLRLPNLPEELTYLQPPPPPADGRWRVFGEQHTLDGELATLEDLSLDRLVPETAPAGEEPRDGKHLDRAFELKKLAKSLLLNFLELTGILGRTPAQAEDKLSDLRTLFVNFHHVLNEYRPHQARESAIALLQTHLDRTRAETANIRSQVERAKRVLEGLESIEVPPPPPKSAFAAEEDGNAAARLVSRDVWGAMDEESGES